MIPGARTFILSIPRVTKNLAVTLDHLKDRGIIGEVFYGLDTNISGLSTRWTYEVDNPGWKFNMGPKIVNLLLGHYLMWKACLYLPEDCFVILEDDVRFDADWKVHMDNAVSRMQDDWDILYIGSCCVRWNSRKRQISEKLWKVEYALCTHAYAIRKKALQMFIEGIEKVWAPVDIAMITEVKGPVQRYAIFPRIADQEGITIEP